MVSVQGLSRDFDERRVLNNIDLQVEPGQIMALMGSSGGGKTTLLRCISGLLPPTLGTVVIDDVDIRTDPEKARDRMGMVFQSAALFDFMTVEENIAFGIDRRLKLKSAERTQAIQDALLRVGLVEADGKKMPADLSGGMRKRLGIARAIALQPRLMLYDEPTTGLDPITTYTIDSLIVQLRRELNMTSIIVSHDVSSVMRVADRVGFLEAGHLVFLGTPSEFETSDHPSIRELIEKSRATTL